MCRSISIVAGMCVLLTAKLCLCAPDSSALPPITVDELLARIVQNRASLHRLLAEYESYHVVSKRRTRFVVAGIEPDRLCDRSYHAMPNGRWGDDPYQQELVVNGTRELIIHPFSHTFIEKALPLDQPLAGTAPFDPLYQVIGWWPLRLRKGPRPIPSTPTIFEDILMSKAYRVRSEPEAIDGISCYVLEYPGHDVLWIDAARGYSIVARELIDPESRSILRSLKASEYHEIGDGIWFPSKINLSGTFAPPVSKAAVSAAPQQRSVEFVISILSVKINGAVAASSAAYSPEPGAVRVLDDNRYLQVVPGGSTQLDELADWMRRMNSHDSQLNKARETSKQLKTWALCSLAFALAGVLYLLPRAVSPFDVRGTPPSIRAEIRRVS